MTEPPTERALNALAVLRAEMAMLVTPADELGYRVSAATLADHHLQTIERVLAGLEPWERRVHPREAERAATAALEASGGKPDPDPVPRCGWVTDYDDSIGGEGEIVCGAKLRRSGPVELVCTVNDTHRWVPCACGGPTCKGLRAHRPRGRP